MAAKSFKPCLAEFTIATTAPRDGNLQVEARKVTFAKTYPFGVSVWSWDDISEELRFRPHLIPASYPKPPLWMNGEAKVKTSLVGHSDQLTSFLQNAGMDDTITPGLQSDFLSLLLELSDNAYVHGHATQFNLTLRPGEVWAEDNGQPFNPLTQLDAARATAQSFLGSLVFSTFLEKNQANVSVFYEVIQSLTGPMNRLIFRFNGSTVWRAPEKPEIRVTIESPSGLGGRERAERYAESIKVTPLTTRVVVNLSQTWSLSISGLFGFLGNLLPRLGPTTRLTFLVRLDLSDEFRDLITDPRIEWINV